MEVYKEAMLTFLPTPTKSHYTFSLRDFSRVIRGVMLVPAPRMKDAEKLIRLWIHESYRVFNDRLIDNDDRESLFKIIKEACYQHYRQHMDKICVDLIPEEETLNSEHLRNLFFGNYIEPDADPKVYDEVNKYRITFVYRMLFALFFFFLILR